MHGLTQAFETKTFLGGIVLLLSYISKSIDEVFFILAVFIILDYITGVLCGMLREGGYNYRIAIKGIVKKLMYLVLIMVTILLEYLIGMFTSENSLNIRVGGTLTTAMYVYLIGTEGLSIIQNLIILGIPVPEYMIKIFGLIRDDSGNLIKK
ncbi:MAG: phage holin family protein [Clostridiaceae bacterium]|nr:phage holin family protein [Clostridiaceae bacterium]